MKLTEFLNNDISFLLTIISSFIISYLFIPTIIRMSRFKKLFDEIDDRKVHKENIPRLGGLAVFAGFIITVLLFIDFSKVESLNGFIAGAVILLFIGLKDDILIISPLTKFIGQFIAAATMIIFGNTLIYHLYGFFGIDQLPLYISVIFSIFIVVTTINAFNFIDGVDGLSSGLAIISASTFGIWFYLAGFVQLALISTAFIFALLGFLRFNFFSKKNKIFLGDTGSMLIGYVLSFLVIKFLDLNLHLDSKNACFILPAPAVAIGIMIIPYFDLIRVVFVRIIRGKKPYQPDNYHMHHIFLKLGFSHKLITLIFSAYSVIFIILIFWFSNFISIRRLLLLEFVIMLFVSFIPEYFLYNKKNGK